jgi:thioredoxin 1
MKTFSGPERIGLKTSTGVKMLILGLACTLGLFLYFSLTKYNLGSAKNNTSIDTSLLTQDTPRYKVTFIELGSVHCIPCIKMQPVIKSVKNKYGSQVNVIFHDVWTPEGKDAARHFVFNVIPTQLFLDSNGKEYSRHEGFFPEEELVKVLQQKGVK